MPTPNTIPIGTRLSFRFVLVTDSGTPLVENSLPKSTSPWSVWTTTTSQTSMAQFVIGDGYAMNDTHRQIWMRSRKPGDTREDVAGEDGTVVQTIKGHGFMFWPDVKQAPSM